MPRLSTLCLFGIALLSGYAPAHAQHRVYHSDSAILRRWSVTLNPLGLVEAPPAVGLGVGYRFGPRIHLWEESSFLLPQNLTFPNGDLTGFRQIIRLSVFPPETIVGNPNFFFAAEFRYKTYSYRDTSDFQDPATGDKLVNVHFLSKHTIFGAALQGGWIFPFSRDGHWSGEATIGLGVKFKQIVRTGPPPGYQYLETGKSVDLNIRDLVETPGYELYLPGSFRIIYAFGRKVR